MQFYEEEKGLKKPVDVFKFLLSGEYDQGDTALMSYDDIYDLLYDGEKRRSIVRELEAARGSTSAMSEKDPLFDEAVSYVKSGARSIVTAKTIRYRFGITHGRASALIDQLEAAGIISKKEDNKPRRVL